MANAAKVVLPRSLSSNKNVPFPVKHHRLECETVISVKGLVVWDVVGRS